MVSSSTVSKVLFLKSTRPLITILKAHDAPLVLAHVGLFDQDPAALVQPSQDAPAKIDVLLQMALKAHDAFFGGVDPDFAGHRGEDLGFQVRRVEIRVGPEAELLHPAPWGRCRIADKLDK